MKVTILSGTSRLGSNTLKVGKAIHSILKTREISSELVSFENYDIPFFNKGFLDRKKATEFQENLFNSWSSSQLIILLSPEYNWFPSAELINLINHVGSEANIDLFENKVFAFAGVSSGTGGRLPAMHMRCMLEKVLDFLKVRSICSANLFEAQQVQSSLTDEGYLLDNSRFNEGIKQFLDLNVELTSSFL